MMRAQNSWFFIPSHASRTAADRGYEHRWHRFLRIVRHQLARRASRGGRAGHAGDLHQPDSARGEGHVPSCGHLDPHPGKNRDSIQVSFRDHPETGWISAWLYTESGYGWLIEHGTSHNRQLTKTAISKRHGKVAANDRTPARPYLLPAVMQFVAQIAERQREILEEGA
jgi:hypothetical protein